jgi:uncharacterized protein (TIGR02996 family)
MTDNLDALLQAILATPDDDDLRLVYADAITEDGQEDRAEFIRVQIELAVLSKKMPLAIPNYIPPLTASFRDGLVVPRDVSYHFEDPLYSPRAIFLKERQMQLSLDSEIGLLTGVPCLSAEWVFERGFVVTVKCRSRDWLSYGDEVCKRHPVRELILTDLFNISKDAIRQIVRRWPHITLASR